MSKIERFNLRVYAIIKNDRGEVLISDERSGDSTFTKFPGGGLEFGEGLKDCLKRELQEELSINAEIGELFYLNEFYQQSVYRKSDQLISFYYSVNHYEGTIISSNHDFPISENGEKFRWVKIEELDVEMMTFPVDKIVVGVLKG